MNNRQRKRAIVARGPSTIDSRLWHPGRADWWVLSGKKPRLARNWAEYVAQREDQKRVAATQIGDVWISTVFLAHDHNYSHYGPPILFESMVFVGAQSDRYMLRYATWKEAEAGHARIVAAVERVLAVNSELSYESLELAIGPGL